MVKLQALEKLNLSGNDLEKLPKTMEQLSRLKDMDLHNCCKLKALPALTQVETLILSDCVNLRSLPCYTGRSREVPFDCA